MFMYKADKVTYIDRFWDASSFVPQFRDFKLSGKFITMWDLALHSQNSESSPYNISVAFTSVDNKIILKPMEKQNLSKI